MAVIVLTGAAGAPGVTTTALALAAAWPRPAVLVEADPAGASAILPGHLRGQVAAIAGIVEAAVARRQDRLPAALPGLLLELPALGVTLLPGLAAPAQRLTMAHEWAALGPELIEWAHSSGVDLIVDAGRLGGPGYPHTLLQAADLVALVTRSSLRAIHAASTWLPEMRGEMPDPQRLHLLVVGPGRPYGLAEIAKHTGAAVLGSLGWDPAAAAVLSDGARPPRKTGSLPAEAGRLAAAMAAGLPALIAAPADEIRELTNA